MAQLSETHTKIALILLIILFGAMFITLPNITGNAVFTQEANQFQQARLNILDLQDTYSELFSTMNWKVTEAQLKQYETQLNQITQNTSSASQQRTQVETLTKHWQNLTSTLPQDIRLETKFADTYKAEPQDLEPYSETPQEAYFFQQQFTIITTITVYDVEYYSGENNRITTVRTTITPEEGTGQATIIQEVPPGTTVSNPTPGIRTQGNNYQLDVAAINRGTTLTYAVIGTAVQPEEIQNYKTLIIPQTETVDTNSNGASVQESYICGDSICSTPFEDTVTCPEDCTAAQKPIPWLLIIIVLVVLFIGLFYLNAYRGKGDLRSLTKGLSPFLTEKDLERVKEYIKKSLDQDKTKKEITKTLYTQGWTKKQIIYAFDEAEWELRKVLIDKAPKIGVSLEPVIIYITKCLQVNMDPLQIKANLTAKGWKAEQIQEAFKKAKK